MGTTELGQCVLLRNKRDGHEMKKNLRYVAIAFVAFYLLSQPTNAANVVNNAFHRLGDAGNSLGTFVNHLGQ